MFWSLGLELELLVVLSLFGAIDCLMVSHFFQGVILHVKSVVFVTPTASSNIPKLATLGQDEHLGSESLLGFILSQLAFHGRNGAGGFLTERMSTERRWLQTDQGGFL